MKTRAFAALLSLLALSGCAYLPSGSSQRVHSDAPQGQRPAQLASAQERPQVVYKKGPGFVDPKVQPYSIKGVTYWPIQSGMGYREDGLASWYGIDFHGKKTATGEVYDMFGVSAAHKTLPLGTKVRVTNLENGRELELTVNDRGPFVDGRIIDLSYASARLLGMADNGVARVRVEGLSDNPAIAGASVKAVAVASAETPPRRAKGQAVERDIMEEPAQKQPMPLLVQGKAERMAERATLSGDKAARPVLAERQAAPAPAPRVDKVQDDAGRFLVQVGAFSQDDNARRVQARLVQAGFGGARISRVVRGGKELMAVHAGSFQDRGQAEAALKSLKDQFPASFISTGA